MNAHFFTAPFYGCRVASSPYVYGLWPKDKIRLRLIF